MASRGTTFAKQDRDRAKKAKAAEKRERRAARAAEGPAKTEPIEVGDEVDAAALLRLVEELHEGHADGRISFEEFEERKAELMAKIAVP
ncbi:MAG: DUF1707 domain-containing protein [Acidimicrobiales bacterium]